MKKQLVTTIAYPWIDRPRPVHIGWRRDGTIEWVSIAALTDGDDAGGNLARCCDIVAACLEFGTDLQRLGDRYREYFGDEVAAGLDELIALIDILARIEREHGSAVGYAYQSTEDRAQGSDPSHQGSDHNSRAGGSDCVPDPDP